MFSTICLSVSLMSVHPLFSCCLSVHTGKQNKNLNIIVPADLEYNGARPSAGIVMMTKLDMFCFFSIMNSETLCEGVPWCLRHQVISALRNQDRPLTHWGRDKMAAIFQTTLLDEFSRLKMYKLRLRFHWSLFPMVQLTIFQHWFR